MIGFLQKRHRQGKTLVPLRYACVAIVALFVVFQLGGALFSNETSVETVEQIVTAESLSSRTEAEAQVALAPQLFDIAKPSSSHSKVSERLQDMLTKVEPAAGEPLETAGVHLPEVRPGFLEGFRLLESMSKDHLASLKKEGAIATEIKIKSGDTFETALVNGLNVKYSDIQMAIKNISGVYDPRVIKPGQTLVAYTIPDLLSKDNDEDLTSLVGLEIVKDALSSVQVYRASANEFLVNEYTKPTTKHLRAAKGKIDGSLYLSANAKGVPDRVIANMIQIYSWSIDFQRDIRKNDEFEVLYEEYETEDGIIVPGRGDILYAALKTNGQAYNVYRFESDNGFADYFEEDGQSVRKALMTTPINGARLSSGFGKRKHPVLGYTKLHKGLDYAAPSGTPIFASGDGIIERMDWFSSFGNYVRIRHRDNLKSAYAHLKGFKKGLSKGSRVRQGDVIGYVGTTGRSTGPHLHYEVIYNNKHVNPKSVKLPTGQKLKGDNLKRFQSTIKETNKKIAKGGLGQISLATR